MTIVLVETARPTMTENGIKGLMSLMSLMGLMSL